MKCLVKNKVPGKCINGAGQKKQHVPGLASNKPCEINVTCVETTFVIINWAEGSF